MSLATSIYIVYETTNLLDGKYYIGVHCGNNPNYFGSGTRLKYAIKKHGRETLREFDNYKDAYDYEREIVDSLMVENKNCYNLIEGGQGGNPPSHLGKIRSDETRRKMSNSMKGKQCGEYSFWYGKHHSIETKLKMSIAKQNISEETKLKMIDSQRNYVYHINENIFDSSKEAANFFNIAQRTILRWCESPNKPNCYRKARR